MIEWKTYQEQTTGNVSHKYTHFSAIFLSSKVKSIYRTNYSTWKHAKLQVLMYEITT